MRNSGGQIQQARRDSNSVSGSGSAGETTATQTLLGIPDRPLLTPMRTSPFNNLDARCKSLCVCSGRGQAALVEREETQDNDMDDSEGATGMDVKVAARRLPTCRIEVELVRHGSVTLPLAINSD
jgi:hypothetical protein